jgi:hypothetical protein
VPGIRIVGSWVNGPTPYSLVWVAHSVVAAELGDEGLDVGGQRVLRVGDELDPGGAQHRPAQVHHLRRRRHGDRRAGGRPARDEVPPVPPPLLPPAEVLPAEPATLDPLELELPPDVLCVPVLPWEVPVPLEPLEPVDPEELEAALVEPDPAVPLEPTEEVAAEVEDPVDAPVVAFVEPQAAIAPISTALRNQSQPAE